MLCLTNRANAGGIGIAFRNGLVLGISKGPGTAGLENDEQFILHTVFVFFCFAFFKVLLLFGHLFDYAECFIFQSKCGAAH